MTKERVYELYCGNGFTVGMATVARRGAAGRMYRRLVDKHLLDEHTGCLTMLGKELVFDAA